MEECNCVHRCNVFDLDLDGVLDEFLESLQPTPKTTEVKPENPAEKTFEGGTES